MGEPQVGHEPVTDAKIAALNAYQTVAMRAPKGAQRTDLFDEAHDILRDQYDRGELDLDISRAIRHVLNDVDRAQGQAADRLVAALREGVTSMKFEGDSLLRTVVTLGGGKRICWEYVTFDDLSEMDLLRRDNVKAVTEAYDVWADNLAVIRNDLSMFGTVGALVRNLQRNSEVAA